MAASAVCAPAVATASGDCSTSSKPEARAARGAAATAASAALSAVAVRSAREAIALRYHAPMRVEVLTHESKLLAGNPLGDPARRDVVVMLPPSYDGTRRFPVVLLLAGFAGNGWQLAFNRAAWQTPLPAAARRRHARRQACARRSSSLPDCFTRYGGSQYVDSPAIGRYQSYLCDELVPFVDGALRTIPRREARARRRQVVGRLRRAGAGDAARPTSCAAAGSHAGDGAFEISYLRELPHTVLTLEKRGGLAAFLRWFEEQPSKGSGGVRGHVARVLRGGVVARRRRGRTASASASSWPMNLVDRRPCAKTSGRAG